MTMFPQAAATTNLYTQNLNKYYGGGTGHLNHSFFGSHLLNYHQQEASEYDNYCSNLIDCSIDQNQVMAEEDESRTETESTTHEVSIDQHQQQQQQQEIAPGSSSKDVFKDRPREDEEDEEGSGWLQLSIGNRTTVDKQFIPDDIDQDGRLILQRRDEEDHQRFIELDLLPNSSSSGGVGNKITTTTTSNSQDAVNIIRSSDPTQQQQYYNYSPVLPPRPTNLFLQHYYPHPPTYTSSPYNFLVPPPPRPPPYENQDNYTNWGLIRPLSSSLMPPSYFSRLPFQVHGESSVVVDAPRLDFKVVDPPRRPHSGIWFTLQASQNQAKEPFLPQIPKSYLRIKDRRMTVRLIVKYLVNKLRLDSESEEMQIEIRCRGQQLLPYLTLQHVRDSIWNTTSPSPPDHHLHNLMVLHYAWTTS